MGTSVYADVKKRKWERKNKEVKEAFYICQDIRTGGFFLFHLFFFFKQTERYPTMLLDLCLFIHMSPFTTHLYAGIWGEHHQHTQVCAQMQPEGCRVGPWGTASWLALTDRGQDLGLLSLVFCVLPAKQTHALRDRGGSRVSYYKVIQTRKY